MGLSQALYSGMSGLVTHNRCMDNIGNNLANVNTTGFKKGVFQFATLLEQNYRGGMGPAQNGGLGSVNPITLGLGTTTGSIDKDFTQGPVDNTGNPTDMAIDGNGFFVVQNGNYNAFTRDGHFRIAQLVSADSGLRQNVLMNTAGMPVMGYRANEFGVIPSSAPMETIPLEIGQVGGARTTTATAFGGNINKNQPVALGTRIVGASVAEPPSWLGRDLVTADTTWPALNEAAAAGVPSVVNGGNVLTSAALGRQVWQIPLDAAGQPDLSNPALIQRRFVSVDAAQAAQAGYAYYDVQSGKSETQDKSELVDALANGTRAPAALGGLDTNLRDVCYYNGNSWVQPFAGIRNGDTIDIRYNVGVATDAASGAQSGLRTVTAQFIYNNQAEQPLTLDNAQSSTLRDWLTFLAGGIDSPTVLDAAPADNTRLTGGVLSTVKLAQQISTADGGDALFNIPPESAGAYTRTGYDQIAYNPNDTLADTFNVSLVSNLGAENALSGMTVSFRSVRLDNFIGDDKQYFDKEGGGTATTFEVYDTTGEKFTGNLRLTLVDRDSNFSTYRWYTDFPADTDNGWVTDADGNIVSNAFTGTGVIRFDADGKLVPSMSQSETAGIQVDRALSGTGTPISIGFVNGAAGDFQQALDFRRVSQVVETSSKFGLVEQDGRPAGTLDRFEVAYDGTVNGIYSNGVSLPLGRLALAMVPNETGLVSAGGNLFYEGVASGQAVYAGAGTGGRGVVRQGWLETSNVELAEEFTRLITTERGFQANARTISTVDEMLVEIVNLKR